MAKPELETIAPRWLGETCVVAGTGPSLTSDIAEWCLGHRLIAVNDAHRLLPFAEVLYGCDAEWWDYHKGVPSFKGEKWSCHCSIQTPKLECAQKYGLRLVKGTKAPGYSLDPTIIHFGGSSGFQAINLAILWGAALIALVGFDMRGSHFFGEHPWPLVNTGNLYHVLLEPFEDAPPPAGVAILNATPNSALKKYPPVKLEDLNRCHALSA